MDMYCILTVRCDEAGFRERLNPHSEFRVQVSGLEENAKQLLHDTFVNILMPIFIQSELIPTVLQKTTVPCLDDVGFDHRKARLAIARPPSSDSESPDNFFTPCSTPSALSFDSGALLCSQNTFV
jgi:hypothetical protein